MERQLQDLGGRLGKEETLNLKILQVIGNDTSFQEKKKLFHTFKVQDKNNHLVSSSTSLNQYKTSKLH